MEYKLTALFASRRFYLLVAMSIAASIFYFQWANQRLRTTFYTREQVIEVAISSNEQVIGAIDRSNVLYLWNITTNQSTEITFPNATLSSFAFHPNNTTVMVNDIHGKIYLYNIQTGTYTSLQLELSPANAKILDGVYNSTGQYIALSGTNRRILVIHSDTGTVFRRFRQPMISGSSDVLKVAFSPNGRYLVSGDKISESTIAVWDIETGQQLGFAICYCHTQGMRFTNDHTILIGNPFDTIIRQDWVEPQVSSLSIQTIETPARLASLAFRANGSEFAWGGTTQHDGYIFSGLPIIGEPDRNIYVVPAADPTHPRLVLRGHSHITTDIVISNDGHWLVSGGRDATVRLWNIQ